MTFLDTNICLDLLSKRSPWHNQARNLIEWHIRYSIDLGVSVVSVPTLSYLLNKHHKTINAKTSLNNLFTFLELLDVNKMMVEIALKNSWKDLEDSIQHECAIFHGANCIITRNKKDFKQSQLMVFTSKEWLDNFAE